MEDTFKKHQQAKVQVNTVGEIRLSEILKSEFKARDISAAEVSRKLHLPKSVLSAWMAGVTPSARNLPMIRKLADFLDLPMEILLFNSKVGPDGEESQILFSSIFKDDKSRYKLTIEKIREP